MGGDDSLVFSSFICHRQSRGNCRPANWSASLRNRTLDNLHNYRVIRVPQNYRPSGSEINFRLKKARVNKEAGFCLGPVANQNKVQTAAEPANSACVLGYSARCEQGQSGNAQAGKQTYGKPHDAPQIKKPLAHECGQRQSQGRRRKWNSKQKSLRPGGGRLQYFRAQKVPMRESYTSCTACARVNTRHGP